MSKSNEKICENCGGTRDAPNELEFISGDCKDSCHSKKKWRALTNSHDTLYPGCKAAVDGTYAALREAREMIEELRNEIRVMDEREQGGA